MYRKSAIKQLILQKDLKIIPNFKAQRNCYPLLLGKNDKHYAFEWKAKYWIKMLLFFSLLLQRLALKFTTTTSLFNKTSVIDTLQMNMIVIFHSQWLQFLHFFVGTLAPARYGYGSYVCVGTVACPYRTSWSSYVLGYDVIECRNPSCSWPETATVPTQTYLKKKKISPKQNKT